MKRALLISALILLLLPLAVSAQIQPVKSFGVKLGFTFNEYGWRNNDPPAGTLYHPTPSISNSWVGVYGEFISMKYLSTMLEAAYRARSYTFTYDKWDSHGNIIGQEELGSNLYLWTLMISEKLRYDFKQWKINWSVYTWAGVKTDIPFKRSPDIDFNSTFSGFKTSTWGITTGLGLALGLKKFRLSFDVFYDNDMNKMYSSPNGDITNHEVGFKVGFAYVFPDLKK